MSETPSTGSGPHAEYSRSNEAAVDKARAHLEMAGRRFIVGLPPNQLPSAVDLRRSLVEESFWARKIRGVSQDWIKDEYLTAAADEAARRLLGEESGLDGEELNEQRQGVVNQAAKGFRSIFEASLVINQPGQATDYGTSTDNSTPTDSPPTEGGRWLDPTPNPHREQRLEPNPFAPTDFSQNLQIGADHKQGVGNLSGGDTASITADKQLEQLSPSIPTIPINSSVQLEPNHLTDDELEPRLQAEEPLDLGTDYPDQRAAPVVARYPGGTPAPATSPTEEGRWLDPTPNPHREQRLEPNPFGTATMETPVGQAKQKRVVPLPQGIWDAYRKTPKGAVVRQFTPRDTDPDEDLGAANQGPDAGIESTTQALTDGREDLATRLQESGSRNEAKQALPLEPKLQAEEPLDLGTDYPSLSLREQANRLHEIFDISMEEAEGMVGVPYEHYISARIAPRRMPAD